MKDARGREVTWPSWRKDKPGLKVQRGPGGPIGTYLERVKARHGVRIRWEDGRETVVKDPSVELRPAQDTSNQELGR